MGGETGATGATRHQMNRREVTVVDSYPKGATLFELVSGGIGATFFPFVYIFAPFYLVFALIALPVLHVQWSTAALIWLPLLLSAMVPPIGSNSCLQSWPFKYFPAYFDSSEIAEIGDSELKELMRTKRVMFVAQPHGVFTFAGASALVSWGRRFWNPETCPTAVASVLMTFPFIKNAVGIFGLVDACAQNLRKTLKTKSVILYAGGIAELFLTDDKEERLYINKHKGFIKLALRSGVAVVPVYMFGNTTTLHVAKGELLSKVARTTHLSLTWFWGVLGTCVPFRKKCMVVIGSPLTLPQIDQPDQAVIDKYHAEYIGEVKRIFDTYKKYNSDYAHKELKFAE